MSFQEDTEQQELLVRDFFLRIGAFKTCQLHGTILDKLDGTDARDQVHEMFSERFGGDD